MRTIARNVVVLLLLAALPLAAESRLPVRGKHAMVASVDVIASRIGADVMKRGGNAVDAAVAIAFVLAVTWPEAGKLGGGGVLLVRAAGGETGGGGYPGTAPAGSAPDTWLDASGHRTQKSGPRL